MRAFAELWDEITRNRYGVADAKLRLFRYGVQVNSLGLTEQQPENNVYRILLEMLAVVLTKNARARAVQLPAWNEALGLPRPWDQQWSLRLQQIVAYETDLLEYGDIFDGSKEIARKVEELKAEALAEMARIEAMGGAVAAIERGLHEAAPGRIEPQAPGRHRERRADRGRRQRLHRDRALAAVAAATASIMTVDADGRERADRAAATPGAPRATATAVKTALAELASAAQGRPQHHGGLDRLRHRPASPPANGPRPCAASSANTARRPASRAPRGVTDGRLEAARREVETRVAPAGPPHQDPGRQARPRRPFQRRRADRRARPRCGMEVVYEGIRLTPERIVNAALEEGVHVVGLSILSGCHVALVRDVMDGLRKAGIGDVPVVVGGIIPPADAEAAARGRRRAGLHAEGFRPDAIMRDIVGVVDAAWKEAA